MNVFRNLLLATAFLTVGVVFVGCVTVYESDEDRVQGRRGPWAEGEVYDVDAFDVLDAASGRR